MTSGRRTPQQAGNACPCPARALPSRGFPAPLHAFNALCSSQLSPSGRRSFPPRYLGGKKLTQHARPADSCPVTQHHRHLTPPLLGDGGSSAFKPQAQRGLREPPAVLETFRNRVFTARVGRGGREDTDETTCLTQKPLGWETHPVRVLRTTPRPALGSGRPRGPPSTRDHTAPGCCCRRSWAGAGASSGLSARLAASCLLLLRVTRLNFTKPPRGLLTLNFRV